MSRMPLIRSRLRTVVPIRYRFMVILLDPAPRGGRNHWVGPSRGERERRHAHLGALVGRGKSRVLARTLTLPAGGRGDPRPAGVAPPCPRHSGFGPEVPSSTAFLPSQGAVALGSGTLEFGRAPS